MPSAGFARPEALLLLAAVALLGLLSAWAEKRRTRALIAFAGPGAGLASVDPGRRRVKLALGLGALALATVALAGPYLDVVRRRVVQNGVDLVVALDVSQSMATRDVAPDRLRLGKELVARLGDSLTQTRVSLVLFSGSGIVRYPATDDPTVLGGALDAVSPAFQPKGGSSLRAAIDSAVLAFSDEARASARRKAVLLVTDGEDLSGQAFDVASLRQRGVHVFTVGVGTLAGGPIPTYDRSGAFLGYLKHPDGARITSHLTEAPLQALARDTGGRYWRLVSVVPTVNGIVTELERLDATRLGQVDGGSVPDDRYQILLGLAVAALLADGLLGDRRGMPRPSWLRRMGPAARRRATLPARVRSAVPWLLLVALVGAACGQVSTSDADRLYRTGDAAGALARYRALLRDHPGVAELHVDAGNALYQLHRYQAAIDEYALALRQGAAGVRAVADYQEGDALFRIGKLDEAREAFKSALLIDPGDRDAKFNIEVIDRVLGAARPPQGQGQPGASAQPGQQGQQGQPGTGQGTASPAGSPSDRSAAGSQPPGAGAPQASGAPASDTDSNAPSMSDALRAFRSRLTADEALRLLDALRSQQRGIEQLVEGSPTGGRGQQDPTY